MQFVTTPDLIDDDPGLAEAGQRASHQHRERQIKAAALPAVNQAALDRWSASGLGRHAISAG
jgi:hypothetical protein